MPSRIIALSRISGVRLTSATLVLLVFTSVVGAKLFTTVAGGRASLSAGVAQQATRIVRAKDATFTRGQSNELIIELESPGDVNSVGFTLRYDPNVLRLTLPPDEAYVVGGGTSRASVLFNTTTDGEGFVSGGISAQPGSIFSGGKIELLKFKFTPVSGGTAQTTEVRITDLAVSAVDPQVTLAATAADAIVTLTGGTPPPTITTASPLPGGTAGVSYAQQFIVTGGTSLYTWAVIGGALPNGLALSPAGVLSGTPTAQGNFAFTVQVTDSASLKSTKDFTLAIACPVIAVGPAALPSGTTGVSFAATTFTATGGSVPYTFSLSGTLPTGMSFVGATLSGTPAQAGSFNVTVKAMDVNGCLGSRDYTLVVVCPTIALAPATLPEGKQGTSYSQTFSASGGTPQYTFSLMSGTLPAGLGLANGILSGTPAASGTFSNLIVKATDANGCTTTSSYTLVIKPPCEPITINPAVLQAGVAGSTYSQQLTASGGARPYTFTLMSGVLPTGLSLSADGLLSGTPNAPGTASGLIIKATDANGCTGSLSYTLVINCPTITVTPATLPLGTAGMAYSSTTFSAAGGIAPYIFSLTGTLPAGMNFSNGILSGTPTQTGNFPLMAKATDASGCMGTRDYTLVISPPTITLAPATLPSGTAGAAYSQTITASGGTAPYTFTLVSGALPAGLSLSADGVLSGTPTVTGTFSGLVIRATDANSNPGSREYALVINCPSAITLTPATLLAGTAGAAYPSTTFAATGGIAPYTFNLSGTLPAGMTFSNGTLSGTPTQTGDFPITVTARDKNGCAGENRYTLRIACPAITINPPSLPDGIFGQPYQVTFVASGGTAPYTVIVSVEGLAFPQVLIPAPDGRYTLSFTTNKVGPVKISIKFTDANGCTGTREYTLNVAQAEATAALASSLNPSRFNQPVTLTATVASNVGGIPTGTVTFKDGVTAIGTADLNAAGHAAITTSALSVGSHAITAEYGGDGNFNGSSSPPLAQTVNKALTSTTLASSLNPSDFGQAVSFTATITSDASALSGTVTFRDGGVPLGTVSLASGRAVLSTSTLVAGPHSITAEYGGDANFETSSANLSQTVTAVADLRITKTDSLGSVVAGSNITYTIIVTNDGPSAASGVIVTDSLPAATTFVACAATGGGVCGGSGNNRTVTFSSLAPGATATFTLTTNVICTTTGSQGISNTVSVSSATADPNPNNNSAAATVTVVCAPKADLTLAGGKTAFAFDAMAAVREPNANPPSDTFAVENTGNAPLTLRFAVSRNDAGGGKITNTDDSSVFPVRLINAGGAESPVPGGAEVEIPAGQRRSFRLLFNPLIPNPAGRTINLFASHVIPDFITSTLTVTPNSGNLFTIPLFGRVTTGARLINPLAPRLAPLVVLVKSGDEFTVEFSAYDANHDVRYMTYQFLDSGNRPVGQAVGVDLDLSQSGMLKGQSFTVVKRFTGAERKPEVNRVKITIYDGEGSDSFVSAPIGTVIGRVVNVSGASFARNAIATEAIVSAFGTGMANDAASATALPLPTELAGARVYVRDSANVERLAPLFYVSPAQINYLIPAGTAPGAATVVIARDGAVVAMESLQVTPTAPAIFAANANGQGVAAALVQRVRGDGSQTFEPVAQYDAGQRTFTAIPIDPGPDSDQVFLVLFGTGIRHRNPLGTVQAKIGGVNVEVLYAGTQGGYAGLDQVNLRVPRTLAGSGEVDVVLVLDGQAANIVRVSIR